MVIEIENLGYTYPTAERPALQDISLRVEKGEFVVVTGANEAGKSTLCYIVAGLVPHFFQGQLSGQVKVCGMDVIGTPRGKFAAQVGMLLQNPFNQISGARFSVEEEVAFGLENQGLPRPEMHARIGEILARVGIAHLASRPPLSLSGGQQQLVALASVLAMQPRVLVLDEPTSQLDPLAAQKVLEVLEKLRAGGMTVLLAEHHTEWVVDLADRIIVLEEGRLLLDGSPTQVLPTLAKNSRGVRLPPVTPLAQAAREAGLWTEGLRLPVTLTEAITGFRP